MRTGRRGAGGRGVGLRGPLTPPLALGPLPAVVSDPTLAKVKLIHIYIFVSYKYTQSSSQILLCLVQICLL
jgi:hypothetical protein